MYNEKRKEITARYVKSHLDDIKIRVKKGEREKLKAIAAEMGMSMNAMFLKYLGILQIDKSIMKSFDDDDMSDLLTYCTEGLEKYWNRNKGDMK